MGSENKDKFWSHTKVYGNGWGWHVAWQGLVVVLIYILLMIIGSFLLARLTPDFLRS